MHLPPTGLTKLLILTGDASADAHAKHIIQQFQKHAPHVEIHAVGGPEITSTGVYCLANHDHLGVLGAGLGLLKAIPYHRKLGKTILRHISDWQPDAVLFVDYGGFHTWLAKQIKRHAPQVKRAYFIPPQVWASRPWRIKKLKANLDHVFCIFPFEEPLYQKHAIPVTYVGHPLTELLAPRPNREVFCQQHGLDPTAWIIGVFPGSRRSEIDTLLPVFLACLPQIQQEAEAPVQFVLARAGTITQAHLDKHIHPHRDALKNVSLHIIPDQSHAVLALSRAALLASGTITLQATLTETPAVIAYKVNEAIYALVGWMLIVPYFGLANILANKPVMPEFLNRAVTPKNLLAAIMPRINNTPQRGSTLRELAEANASLMASQDLSQPPSYRVMQGLITLCETNHTPHQSTRPLTALS